MLNEVGIYVVEAGTEIEHKGEKRIVTDTEDVQFFTKLYVTQSRYDELQSQKSQEENMSDPTTKNLREAYSELLLSASEMDTQAASMENAAKGLRKRAENARNLANTIFEDHIK